MELSKLAEQPGEWLRGTGPESDARGTGLPCEAPVPGACAASKVTRRDRTRFWLKRVLARTRHAEWACLAILPTSIHGLL